MNRDPEEHSNKLSGERDDTRLGGTGLLEKDVRNQFYNIFGIKTHYPNIEFKPNIEKQILDTANYGAPPENSGIEILIKRERTPSDKGRTQPFTAPQTHRVPQAYCDEKGNWSYNYRGAKRLAELTGRILPTIAELMYAYRAFPEDFIATKQEPLHIWSSDNESYIPGENYPHCAFLLTISKNRNPKASRMDDVPFPHSNYMRNLCSVRFLKNNDALFFAEIQ